MVLEPSHTTSGETSVRAPWTVAERASSTKICLASLTLKLGQAPISQKMVPLLGHVVYIQGLMVDPTKIVVILNLEALRSVKQLLATLGHTRYNRKFIKSYAHITSPMEKLLKKDVMFCLNDDCMKSLDVLKDKLASDPI